MHASERNRGEGYRAVVVEDEPLIRRNICRKIAEARCGFTVVGSAADGESAIALLKDECPNLLVTDIKMPGIDGLTLIEHASRLLPNLRTIVISGYGEFEYAQRSLQQGVRDYLLKPVRNDHLRRALGRVRADLDSEQERSREIYRQLGHARVPAEAAAELELFLRHHYTERIDLQRTAEALNINYASVGRLFKRYYGLSPMKYLTALRTTRAKQLLIEEPDLDIRAISELMGYEDQGYFTRVFKLNTGTTPTDYRNDHTEGTNRQRENTQ